MAGLDDPNTIDLITQADDGEFALIITHEFPWNGSPTEVEKLADKLNTYAAFALDEGLITRHPEFEGHGLRVQIDAVDPPTGDVSRLIDQARAALAEYDIDLVVTTVLSGP